MDKSKVIDIIKNKVSEEIAITEETDIVNDLGFNSFDVATMVSEIEDELDIEIDDSDMKGFSQIKDIFEYVSNKNYLGNEIASAYEDNEE